LKMNATWEKDGKDNMKTSKIKLSKLSPQSKNSLNSVSRNYSQKRIITAGYVPKKDITDRPVRSALNTEASRSAR
jgi:hypothetical protein